MVNLYIDTKGFYLICVNKVKKVCLYEYLRKHCSCFSFKEIECFDLALIHDTRTGSQVTLPQVE
jgi:hypothetical protein